METAPDADAGDPTFVVTDVSVPRELRLGGALVLAATVTNDGAVDGTERVNYSFGGATVTSKSVSLDAGASTEVRFRATSADLEGARGPIAVGTYVHGVRNDSGSGIARRVRVTPDVDFAMNSFDAPTDVSRDEPYVVLATVENPGNVTITRDVTYRFESQVVAERAVTVAAGEERQVAFEVAIDGIESVVGPIRNDTTYHHAVRTTGGSGQGGAVRVVHGPSADASALAVEEFEATGDVGPGETVRVDVTVRNVASNDFEGQLSYRLDDSVVATEWTRVPIGERRTVSFRVDYAAIERAAVPLSARDTTHGVWVGDDAIRTRPVTVRAPVEGAASATPAATFSPAPQATDEPAGGADDGGTAAADGSTCARGLVTKCGGTVVSEFTLTMLGIVTSVLGIVFELTRGN